MKSKQLYIIYYYYLPAFRSCSSYTGQIPFCFCFCLFKQSSSADSYVRVRLLQCLMYCKSLTIGYVCCKYNSFCIADNTRLLQLLIIHVVDQTCIKLHLQNCQQVTSFRLCVFWGFFLGGWGNLTTTSFFLSIFALKNSSFIAVSHKTSAGFICVYKFKRIVIQTICSRSEALNSPYPYICMSHFDFSIQTQYFVL